jgi:hypothetical protein
MSPTTCSISTLRHGADKMNDVDSHTWDDFYEHALALGLTEDEAIDYADHRVYMYDLRHRGQDSVEDSEY